MNDLANVSAQAGCTPFASFAADARPASDPLRQALRAAFRRDETEAVQWLLSEVGSSDAERTHR